MGGTDAEVESIGTRRGGGAWRFGGQGREGKEVLLLNQHCEMRHCIDPRHIHLQIFTVTFTHAHTHTLTESLLQLSPSVGPARRKCVFYITVGSLPFSRPPSPHLLPLTIETDQNRELHHLITRCHQLIKGLCLTISIRLQSSPSSLSV